MTLPASGPISLSMVAVELGRAANAPISLGETAVRNLAGIASGPISLSNLYGKSAVVPPTWNPVGGSYLVDETGTNASFTITCSESCVWTWSRLGDPSGTANRTSGTSALNITFSLPMLKFSDRFCTFNVSASARGFTQNWVIDMEVYGA